MTKATREIVLHNLGEMRQYAVHKDWCEFMRWLRTDGYMNMIDEGPACSCGFSRVVDDYRQITGQES